MAILDVFCMQEGLFFMPLEMGGVMGRSYLILTREKRDVCFARIYVSNACLTKSPNLIKIKIILGSA